MLNEISDDDIITLLSIPKGEIEEEYTFPEDFETRIDEMFNKYEFVKDQKQKGNSVLLVRLLKVAAAFVLITFIILKPSGVLAIAKYAYREIVRITETSTVFHWDNISQNTQINASTEMMSLQYIPEGFKMVRQSNDANEIHYYEDEKGNYFVLSVQPKEGTSLVIDSEDARYSEYRKGEDIIREYQENDEIILIWQPLDKVIYLQSNLSRDETRKILEYVNFK